MKNFSELLKKVQNYDSANKTETETKEEITREVINERIDNNYFNGDLEEVSDYYSNVSSMVFDISQIIKLANELKKKGVSLSSKPNRGVFANNFMADGNGYLGFDKEVSAIGFIGGGVRSAFDFFVDGTGIYLCIGDDRKNFDDLFDDLISKENYEMARVLVKDYINYLKKFEKRFSLFKEGFISFINEL